MSFLHSWKWKSCQYKRFFKYSEFLRKPTFQQTAFRYCALGNSSCVSTHVEDVITSLELASLKGVYTQGIYKRQQRQLCNLLSLKKPHNYLGLFLDKPEQPSKPPICPSRHHWTKAKHFYEWTLQPLSLPIKATLTLLLDNEIIFWITITIN